MELERPHSSNGISAVNETRDLYAYNRWANLRMLEAVDPLDEAELIRDLGSSFSSIRDTLVHMVSADWVWLCRWKGNSPTGVPGSWNLSSLAAVRHRWEVIEDDRSTFLTLLTEQTLSGEIVYRTLSGQQYRAPLWQLMRHVVNHATYHRGQITTMLRQLGWEPASTDLVLFHRGELSMKK